MSRHYDLMSTEATFIASLRAIATAPAARGLADDAAVLEVGGTRLVLTMDAIVEGTHFLPQDPAETVAWKLVATNVSDLAAKGAAPRGCLLTYSLSNDDSWNAAFLGGLDEACRAFAIPLLGGDTVRPPQDTPRSFSLVAIGEPAAGVTVPSRHGAKPGDVLWVSGPIGDAGLGLALLQGRLSADAESRTELIGAYQRPQPCPNLGIALAPLVNAMMDVSDGLLIDSQRMIAASETAANIEVERIPLSRAYDAVAGNDCTARLTAATAGDDYCLLFAAPVAAEAALRSAAGSCRTIIHPIGAVQAGVGLTLTFLDRRVPLPDRLGFEH
jgi:thiamine-monophosphate kinase